MAANAPEHFWWFKRLACLMPREVPYRIRQIARSRFERCGLGIARNKAIPSKNINGRPWVLPLPRGFDGHLYAKAADDILAGRFDIFALRGHKLGFPPEWCRDPRTKRQAPLKFGKSINYRNQRLVGDIKYLWEINRHLELVTLAQAWHLTRNDCYALGARSYLSSWFRQNPYLRGPNWASGLELAIRTTNWAVAWYLLGGKKSFLFEGHTGYQFQHQWLQSIYQHCHFLSRNLSRFSSANNHLLGELMGLYVAAVAWPLWPESRQWRELARDEFQAQALKQNFSDGVNREQAIHYLHEVADMMLIVWRFAEANGESLSKAFSQRIESMLTFLAALMDTNGNVPMIGDSDDAVMVRFSQEPAFCHYRSLLATGALLYQRRDFQMKARSLDDKTRWLLGDEAATRFKHCDDSECITKNGIRKTPARDKSAGESLRRIFSRGGYWVMGTMFDQPGEVRIVADAGPLGYLPIAAHGHADALSLTLSVNGREILIDPGTFCYHGNRVWRDYFRGTSAHNTLRVDGLDQSVSGGTFVWLKHARAVCEKWTTTPEFDRLVVRHDGYARLADPVSHRREIVLDKKHRVIEIRDKVSGKNEHTLELFWHCHEEASATIQDGKVLIRRADVAITMSVSDPRFTPRIVSGQENPPLGWVSRRFDRKQPCPVAVWQANGQGVVELTTRMVINGPSLARKTVAG